MKQPSPMMYFTPLYKEIQAKSDRQMALVDAQTPLVRHLYDELLIDLQLGPSIISCNAEARSAHSMSADTLAKNLSRWATTHVLGAHGLPGNLAAELRLHSIPDQMRVRLEALYTALLLARIYEPGAVEDRVIRAVLDNRPNSALSPEDNEVIATIEEDVAPFYRNGDPDKPAMLHQAVFLNGALLQFFEKDGKIVYFNHKKTGNFHYRVCPPMLSLAKAMHRLMAAFDVAAKANTVMRVDQIDADELETRMIDAIRARHAQGPLTLASPQSISDLNVRQILCGKEVCDG
ncbi:hypothetical protein OCEANICA350_12816 [Oceanicaulis sp. 350]|nr:hypothetical protein OCEANICA350_12816 [Oceanicaulis sp. 350]